MTVAFVAIHHRHGRHDWAALWPGRRADKGSHLRPGGNGPDQIAVRTDRPGTL